MYLHMDLQMKMFLVYIWRIGCFVIAPQVNTSSKKSVEREHLHTRQFLWTPLFSSGPLPNSSTCWYIPQVWWVQMLPKETLSVVDENKETPILRPFTPKGANLITSAPTCLLLCMTSKKMNF